MRLITFTGLMLVAYLGIGNSVCWSVRPFITLWYCVQTVVHIIELLLRCRLLTFRRQRGKEESGGCISWRLPAYSMFILTASVWEIVLWANCLWGESYGARRPWGETLMGRNVLPWPHGAKCPWGEKSWHLFQHLAAHRAVIYRPIILVFWAELALQIFRR